MGAANGFRIVGLDLSLTATGIADETGTGVAAFPRVRGMERLSMIARTVDLHVGIITVYPADLVVIEGYSFNSKQGGEHLGELGGVIRLRLWQAGIPFIEVPPAALKKFATGKGNAPKDAVLAAAVRAGFEGNNNNEADAWWLRQMGLYALCPIHSDRIYIVGPTAYRDDAVAKVEWPTLGQQVAS